ncbi:hypothetical protein CLV59_104596 [Chitinophaga dinghuensis]|uniref:PXPV repeat-containing protein n=1 Tax=Chitinophaga dinghuensis TaxID=1539050 RepID=A0A327VZE8_9BACT|nr:hypothetical protein [Chitinophaga dinghuensis]RAJ82369.1 hypothetical protein CLV59_104596 [Chitinophaga dinghuensis]
MKKLILLTVLLGGVVTSTYAQRGYGHGWGRGNGWGRGHVERRWAPGPGYCRPARVVVYDRPYYRPYYRPAYYAPVPVVPVPVAPVPVPVYPRPRAVIHAGVTIGY